MPADTPAHHPTHGTGPSTPERTAGGRLHKADRRGAHYGDAGGGLDDGAVGYGDTGADHDGGAVRHSDGRGVRCSDGASAPSVPAGRAPRGVRCPVSGSVQPAVVRQQRGTAPPIRPSRRSGTS